MHRHCSRKLLMYTNAPHLKINPFSSNINSIQLWPLSEFQPAFPVPIGLPT